MALVSHKHPEHEKKALQLRLRKIAGQITAIERMVGEDRDCPEVLTQVVSARKALKAFAELVIHDHLHHCIEGAHSVKEGQRKLKELLTVLQRFVE
jgi:DNA-binding FrmR family transcriptional regulator